MEKTPPYITGRNETEQTYDRRKRAQRELETFLRLGESLSGDSKEATAYRTFVQESEPPKNPAIDVWPASLGQRNSRAEGPAEVLQDGECPQERGSRESIVARPLGGKEANWLT